MKYNALNQLTEAVMPDGSALRYSYDKGGLFNKISKQETEFITNITYNAKGQRENIYYGNNTKTRYDYHPENFRLIRLLTSRNTGQDILQDLNYEYDAEGNITAITDGAQETIFHDNQIIDARSTYSYDALYRLTSATGRELSAIATPSHKEYPYTEQISGNAVRNYIHQYTYDELGNMISNAWMTNHYAQSNNRLLKHDRQTLDQYTYDEHGNITSMPHLTDMVWNENDELIGATNETSFISLYNYDAGGNRTRKITIREGGILETRYYIGKYELFKKENSTDDYLRSTLSISDDEKVFARIESKDEEDPVIRYQYDNHLGSSCLELDNTGLIISYEEYYPFGSTSYYMGKSGVEISLKRYRYCGKERDEETGLYYYGMRYYADWLCRFVSVDPLQFKYPHYTPYQYASNNPVTMIDLDGLEGVRPEDTLVQQQEKTPSPTSLMIDPSDTQAKADILSLVGSDNQDYVYIDDDGRVSLDFGDMDEKGIKKALRKDSGLKLINDIISATKEDGTGYSFFYGTQEKSTGITLENPKMGWKGEHFYLNMSLSGINTESDSHGGYLPQFAVVNASSQPYSKDGKSFGYIPSDNYDAKVFIRQGTFKNIKDITRSRINPETRQQETIKIGEMLENVDRKGVIFHELRESYLRTAKGLSYDKAHRKAGGTGAIDRYFPKKK